MKISGNRIVGICSGILGLITTDRYATMESQRGLLKNVFESNHSPYVSGLESGLSFSCLDAKLF